MERMACHKISTENGTDSLKPNLLDWIERCRIKGYPYGRYRFYPSEKAPYMLYASCFAAMARELVNDLQFLSYLEKREWIKYLQSHQDPNTGFFYDPVINNKFLSDFVTWQITYFCFHSLDALGSKPLYPFRFFEKFRDKTYLIQWLEKLNFKRAWFESNKVMFVSSFLYYEWSTTKDPKLIDLIRTFLDWFDENQDPKTGYWGTDKGAPLYDAMAGAYHIYMFYYACGRPINYLNYIINTTLKLQTPEGSFVPGGRACIDLDAVDILVNISSLTDYRAEDVRKCLHKAFHSIYRQRRASGGFAEAAGSRLRLLDWFYIPFSVMKHKDLQTSIFYLKKALKRQFMKRPETTYSGVKESTYLIKIPDIWSAWFRPLALALISKRYPAEFLEDIDWHFRRLPGLGYYPENI